MSVEGAIYSFASVDVELNRIKPVELEMNSRGLVGGCNPDSSADEVAKEYDSRSPEDHAYGMNKSYEIIEGK